MLAELFLAKRYLSGKKRESLVFFLSIVAVVGISLGVAALIIVLSVMSGFDEEIKSKILGEDFHIFAEVSSLEEGISFKEKVASFPEVTLSVFYKDTQGFLQTPAGIIPVYFRMVQDEYFKDFSKYTSSGSSVPREKEVVMGRVLFERSFLPEGEIVFLGSDGREITFSLKDTFQTGFYDIDSKVVLASFSYFGGIFEDVPSQVGIKLKRIEDLERVADRIKEQFPEIFFSTWSERNKSLFSALKLEKITMFFILSMIILVASFNIISILLIKVVQKMKDIGVLKSIGASPFFILRLFISEGLLIGLAGTFIGSVLGVTLSFLIEKYHIIRLPQDIYYIDFLPAKVQLLDISLVLVCSLLLSFLASLFPAIKAKNVDASSCLRYE